MYDDSSITDTESLSPNASVASILGIKGGLRLRHHTVSQKAHAILRRVEASEDSSDDGKGNPVVYFRLFAHKPINVKPGKELLLTIASADGRFKDRVVLFEGNLRGSDDDSDHEGTTQVEEEPQVIEEEEEIIPQAAMPPKMRRQWTRRVEEVSPVVLKIPVAHTSVGVQARPEYISSPVQAQPEYICSSVQASSVHNSVSIQVQPSQTFASVQTHSSHASIALQADPPPPPSYNSLDVQTDPILTSSIHQTMEDDLEHAPSFSPIQPGTPDPSSTGFPPLSIEIPGYREPSEDMQMSPTEVKMEDSEESIPCPSDSMPTEGQTRPSDDMVKFTPMIRIKDEITDPSIRVQPPARPARPVTDMFDLDDTQEPVWIPSPRIPKPPARNSFVSGGFVTDFVGAVALPVKEVAPAVKLEEPATVQIDGPLDNNPSAPDLHPSPLDSDIRPSNKAQSRSHRRRAEKRVKLRAEAQAAAAIDASTLIVTESSVVAAQGVSRRRDDASSSTHAAESTGPPQLIPSTSALAIQRARAPIQNAVASSSKVVSGVPPPPAPYNGLPGGSMSILPRELTMGRAKEKAPATALQQLIKSDIDMPSPSGSTPPPEPKALAYIPAGPASNPLNIRPSSPSLPPPLAGPSTSTAATPKTKKRVLVARGWGSIRAVNGAAVGAAVPASSQPAPNPGGLSSIVGYSTPSPPPADNPVSKWKRIDAEISIGVGPQDDDSPVDMVLSEPSSPVSEPPPLATDDGVSTSLPLKNRILTDTSPKLLDRISSFPLSIEAERVSEAKSDGISLLARMSPGKGNPSQSSSAYRVSLPEEPKPLAAPSPTPAQKTSSTSSQAKSTTNASSKQVSSSQKRSVQLPINHPLPAKPPPSAPPQNPLSGSFQRGIKRERPPSPDLWTAPGIVRIQRRRHRWPTVEWTHSAMLTGDGDLGIRRIAFSSDGSFFALHCSDRTLRIWNSKTRLEIARLPHSSQVIALAWMDAEAAVLALGEDGVLGKWRVNQNQWQWGRIVNVGSEKRAPEDKVCLAHARDRIAVAFPRSGVKVWIWHKGSWLAQRSIMRTNVTALRFIDGGDALLGGTREGAVWHCAVPNGTMKVYAFLQSSITSIDVNPTGTHALIAQSGGSACLVSLGSHDEKRVGKSYVDSDVRDGAFGAIFSTQGKTVLFGTVDGCLLVWDTQKGALVYGMEHEDGDLIQAVASCSGPQGCVVTGTRQGRLAWWPQPTGQAHSPPNASRKRAKVK